MKLTDEQTEFLNKVCDHKWTEKDGLVEVDGNVSIISYKYPRLPVMFGTVSGMFKMTNCMVESLDGFPTYIGNKCLLTNIDVTEIVNLCKVKYRIVINTCKKLKKIKNLHAETISITFCDVLEKIELEESVVDTFSIADCKKIKNLHGFPKTVTKMFNIYQCEGLEDLSGTIEHTDTFRVSDCKKLRSGKGACKNANKYDIDLRLLNNIDELKLYRDDDIYAQWLHSGEPAEGFLEKKRGFILGRKFGF